MGQVVHVGFVHDVEMIDSGKHHGFDQATQFRPTEALGAKAPGGLTPGSKQGDRGTEWCRTMTAQEADKPFSA